MPFHTYKVSGSFNSLSRVLFNFPSRYLYAIGLETYLRLEVSVSQFHTPYPRNATLDTLTSCLSSNTGLSPSAVLLSRRLLFDKRGLKEGPKPHISDVFPRQIRFAVCGVQSLLLTASQLISFPSGTKTFQFPEFPDLSVSSGCPIRKSLVQRLHTPRQGITPFVASFIGVSSLVLPLIGFELLGSIINYFPSARPDLAFVRPHQHDLRFK